jgi:hypothetical protein
MGDCTSIFWGRARTRKAKERDQDRRGSRSHLHTLYASLIDVNSVCRNRNAAYPRVRLAMVSRWRALVREIVRQQWNFSPPNPSREVEEYQFDLSGVTVLELIIVPDISRGSARASLKSLRLS